MTQEQARRFGPGVILGILLIVGGGLFFLDNIGLLHIDFSIWKLWPLILVAIGLVKLLEPSPLRKPILGLFLVGIGILFLLDQFGRIEFELKYIWPLLIILVGVHIIRVHVSKEPGKTGFKGCSGMRREEYNEDYLNFSAIMGGGGYRILSRRLKGGRIMAVLGGFELNLRDADMEGSEMHIEITTIMGGVEVTVPTTWAVVMQGTPLMGGFENNTAPVGEAKKKLYVNASVILGGVEFKN